MSTARGTAGAGGARMAQHAASASPRRGVPARSLAPSRLFTASVHSIRKDKTRYSPKKIDAEESGDGEVCDSSSQTRPQPIHLLQEREEPSGAETDDCEDEGPDVVGTSPKGLEESYDEDIRVKLEIITQSEPHPELSPVSSASDNFEEGITPGEVEEDERAPTSLMLPDPNTDNCDVVVQGVKGKRAPTHFMLCENNTSHSESDSTLSGKGPAKRLKKKSKLRKRQCEASSSEYHSSSSQKRKSSDTSSSKGQRREQSKLPKGYQKRRHQSSPDYARGSSSISRSKSACEEQHSSSRRKKHNSSSDDAGESRSFCEVDVKPRKSGSRALVDSDYDFKTSKVSRHSTTVRDAHVLRHLSKSDVSADCKQMDPTPGIKHNPSVAPLTKMSSSEAFVATAISSESEEDIVSHQRTTVGDGGISNYFAAVHTNMRSANASTAPDFIPLSGSYQQNESFKPDTPYRMPASQTTDYRSPQVSHPTHHQSYSSPFSPQMYSTPPPQPAAPSMRSGGLFHWDTNIAKDSLSPLMDAPNAFTRHKPPPPPPPESDKRFMCLQNLHVPPKPNFHGYQLIGDSMLLRFSQQLLSENAIMAESLRFLGYCVSGQTVGELLRRLRSGFYHLGKKVVLMIGTNDLLKNTHLHQMCTELRRVVEFLRSSVEEIIVLTLPPIPRLENMTYHWRRLNTYNDSIKSLSNKDSGISVYDISPQYILTQEELEEAELLAEFNAESPFCPGCLTCMEDGVDWDYPGQSDEDDIGDTAMLTRVFINTSPPVIKPVDICKLFEDRRISRCRMECFEMFFSENSSRKDMIHLNKKGLTVVKEELYKAI